MMKVCRNRAVRIFLGLLLLFSIEETVFGQQASKKPTVVLTQPAAPSHDAVATELAASITQSVGLMLQLTGRVTVQRADFLFPNASLQRAVAYYRKVGADEAVYGSVEPAENGSYVVDLSVWNATGSKQLDLKRTIANLLSSFSVADEISLKIASAVVGKKLAEGRLVVKGAERLPKFSVYADGHLLGRNRLQFPVLTGKREVIIAKPGVLGDEPVQVFHVTIKPNETTTITLAKNPAPTTAKIPAPQSSTETKPQTKPPVEAKQDQSSPTRASSSTVARSLNPPASKIQLSYQGAVSSQPAVFVYGSRSYLLTSPGRYLWALTLLSNLPSLSASEKSDVKKAEKEQMSQGRRHLLAGSLVVAALGGLAAAVYGQVKANSTARTTGIVVGLGALAGAIPSLLSASHAKKQIEASVDRAVNNYNSARIASRPTKSSPSYFNSQADFSKQQGFDNWYYGYEAGKNGAFQLMTDYNRQPDWGPNYYAWWANFSQSWAYIAPDSMHPNISGKTGRFGIRQDSVRRFVVPRTATYRITVQYHRWSQQGKDGTILTFQRNRKTVWSTSIGLSDTTLRMKADTIACRAGDTLDFILDGRQNNDSDATYVVISVEPQPSGSKQ